MVSACGTRALIPIYQSINKPAIYNYHKGIRTARGNNQKMSVYCPLFDLRPTDVKRRENITNPRWAKNPVCWCNLRRNEFSLMQTFFE